LSGVIVVANGKNVASGASIHPRTAIGIKVMASCSCLRLMAVKRSAGLKVSEVADFLIRFGTRRSISTGGGSTTFVMHDRRRRKTIQQ
jgi:hypothetical protein